MRAPIDPRARSAGGPNGNGGRRRSGAPSKFERVPAKRRRRRDLPHALGLQRTRGLRGWARSNRAKLVIIGSGAAGCTAGIYAARAMLEPGAHSRHQPGGQLTITTDVENYPGFVDVIQGPWLMEQMQKQAEHVGTSSSPTT